MDWVTRKNIKVDRVACPWLIKKFVDPEARFLFVAEEELLQAATAGAVPFDAPRLPQVKLNHRGERCSFEAIIEDFKVNAPGLPRLALIVRAADIKGQEHAAPEGAGLRAIAEGFASLGCPTKSACSMDSLFMTHYCAMRRTKINGLSD